MVVMYSLHSPPHTQQNLLGVKFYFRHRCRWFQMSIHSLSTLYVRIHNSLLFLCHIRVKNSLSLYRENKKIQVTISRFFWYAVLWCGTKQSSFLVKLNASSIFRLFSNKSWRIWLIPAWLGLFYMARSRILFPMSEVLLHLAWY